MQPSGRASSFNRAFFLPHPRPFFTAEAVRSLATPSRRRRRRPLPAELFGHLGNIVTGIGDPAPQLARLRRADPIQ
jgi:hypothetical protein